LEEFFALHRAGQFHAQILKGNIMDALLLTIQVAALSWERSQCCRCLFGARRQRAGADNDCASIASRWGRVFVRSGRRYPTDDVPPVEGGQPDLNKFFVEMFGLVMPEKVAEAVVAKDVKMTFDPDTKGS